MDGKNGNPYQLVAVLVPSKDEGCVCVLCLVFLNFGGYLVMI